MKRHETPDINAYTYAAFEAKKKLAQIKEVNEEHDLAGGKRGRVGQLIANLRLAHAERVYGRQEAKLNEALTGPIPHPTYDKK